MSEFTRYSFIPWLRQGIANSINEADGDGSAKVRASFDVRLKINDSETTDTVKVNLVGPGDIIGINPQAIVRTEPLDWITDFEPNYLAFAEFYDEDFPWRYTPAKGNESNHRLRPWLTLVVLKEDEFDDDNAVSGPLNSFTLKSDTGADLFADPNQLWSWAHVHVNEDLSDEDENNVNKGIDQLTNILDSDPDKAYSRLMCPRKLEPNTAYHAFLIPTFETGRLAGLGQEVPDDMTATKSAWDGPQKQYPIYYRWFFRTAESGDFEFLVRQLKPRPADKRVGIRPMDVTDPGVSITGITDPSALGLEGALRAPQTEPTDWPRSFPDDFQSDTAERINLKEDYKQSEPGEDPVITPPLYARWHALTRRLSIPSNADTNWVHELNLDPRQRTAAGFGTKVIRKNQEEYMNSAWEQIGEVLEANKKIRWIQFAWAATSRMINKFMNPLDNNRLVSFTANVHSKLLVSGKTAFARIKNSKLEGTVFSPVFRKTARIRGPLIKRFALGGLSFSGDLLSRMNNGDITPATPKKPPEGATGYKDLEESVKPEKVPQFIRKILTKWWIAYLPLFILIVAVILFLLFRNSLGGLEWPGIIILILLAVSAAFIKWWKDLKKYHIPSEEEHTGKKVEDLPEYPDFELVQPGESTDIKEGDEDNEAARNFKTAVADVLQLHNQLPPEEEEPPSLDLPGLTRNIRTALQPDQALLKRSVSVVKIPADLSYWDPDTIKPVMAYPEFDTPMYEPLRNISTELLVPNLNLIPQNSITLLETNQRFIESYMVGLNHEMARELLWREYVTDQRGSYFRQFWDVSNYVNMDDSLSEEELKEKLRDIKPIHTWQKSSDLGKHNNREDEGDITQLVLVIRGDLLKKYPNAVIYAQKAKWQTTTEDGEETIDNTEPRLLQEVDETSKEDIKYPLYGAKVEPDITFLGFDLTAEEAKGGSGEPGDTDPGWFFVIEERVGEPRFGLDVVKEESDPPSLDSWNDMSWKHINKDSAGNLKLSDDITLDSGSDNPENVIWGSSSNAADMAYILFQLPVRVGVHASEMLKGIE